LLTIRYENETAGCAAARDFLTVLFTQIGKNMTPEDEEYDLIKRIESSVEKEPGKPLSEHFKSSAIQADCLWSQVVQNASGYGALDLISAIHRLEPFISWIDDPGYRSHNINDSFINTYRFFEIMGTNGVIVHKSVTIGIMVLGADFYYPSHSHPDYECIYAFSGRGTWHMENGPIISIPAGTRIFIPPDSAHTFWTMAEPFAAIYMCLKHEKKLMSHSQLIHQ